MEFSPEAHKIIEVVEEMWETLSTLQQRRSLQLVSGMGEYPHEHEKVYDETLTYLKTVTEWDEIQASHLYQWIIVTGSHM